MLWCGSKGERMSDDSDSRAARGGCFGLGSVVAAVLSAALNHSFCWGFLHFVLGWIYVLYALIVRSREILPALRQMLGV